MNYVFVDCMPVGYVVYVVPEWHHGRMFVYLLFCSVRAYLGWVQFRWDCFWNVALTKERRRRRKNLQNFNQRVMLAKWLIENSQKSLAHTHIIQSVAD